MILAKSVKCETAPVQKLFWIHSHSFAIYLYFEHIYTKSLARRNLIMSLRTIKAFFFFEE